MMAEAIMNANGYQTGRDTDHLKSQSNNCSEWKCLGPDVIMTWIRSSAIASVAIQLFLAHFSDDVSLICIFVKYV